jgi:hypothetical protein
MPVVPTAHGRAAETIPLTAVKNVTKAPETVMRSLGPAGPIVNEPIVVMAYWMFLKVKDVTTAILTIMTDATSARSVFRQKTT